SVDVSGHASLTISTLSAGDHPITANYSGSGQFNPSITASATTQSVGKASTATALITSGSPSNLGDAVTFTATVSVTAPGGGSPSGTVTFKDGGTDLETVTLAGASASLTTTALAGGSHTITAVYDGDASFLTSTSNSVSQVVNRAPTSAALTANINPSVFGE